MQALVSNNPKGGKPDKIIRDALMGAIRQSPQKLKKAAENVLDRASEGDQHAIQFLADRIDGRAPQSIDVLAAVQHMFEPLIIKQG